MATFFRRLLALLSLGLGLLGAGCGGGGGSGDSPAVPPSIQTAPVAQLLRANEAASFSVVAVGDAPLTYQWLRNGVAIAGATASSYTLESAQPADSGTAFSVTVSNQAGSVTSASVLLAVPAKVAGLILEGSTSVQVVDPAFTLRGEILYELPGDAPTLKWKLSGASTAVGSTVPSGGKFAIPLTLDPGDTLIEILAEDGQGTPIVYKRSVTRNAVGAFVGTLELSKDVTFVGEATEVIARIALASALIDPTSVRLLEVAADGSESEVATLADGGDLAAGDEIQGDGVYSGKFTVTAAAEGQKVYRVRVLPSGSSNAARSVVRKLLISARLSDDTLTKTLSLQTEATTVLQNAGKSGLHALLIAVTEQVTALNSNSLVLHAAPNEAGTAISVLYKSGIAGVIGQPDAGVKGGSAALAQRSARGGLLLPRPSLPAGVAVRPYAGYCAAQPGAKSQEKQPLAATPNTPTLGSNRVYVLAANYAQWGENDDVPSIAAELQKNPCLDVTYKKTTTAGGGSVEDFKNLDKYGMVLVSSHGDTHFTILGFSQFSASFVIEGWAPASSQVVMYSNMAVTPQNKKTYEEDLKAGRLVIWGNVYGIMPSFIQKYSGKMPDSLVYMSICRGTWNNTLADAFIGNGAKAYLGYSDYVAVPFTISVGSALFTEFLKSGKTLADAFDPISPKVETDSDPAEFKLVGSKSVALGSGGLNDGGFESGTLGSWTAVGDGRVVSQLGDALPTNGTYMAIISTGLGFTTDAGSVAQTLCLGSETTMSFRWNFFSEEFLEYVGSVFQDSFTVTIEDAADPANIATVLAETVDSLAAGVSVVSNSFDQGDVYATGWRTKTFNIPEALRNRKVIIRFAVSDVGDSIYDTAVLVDQVTLQ